ncbi:MAG: efflux RND transporter permease subunit [Limibacillus sp.]
MLISDLSVTRPVLAAVGSLLLIAFGIIAFDRLPLREYPDIDPPVVSITTDYPGAAAQVIETRITEIIEERIAGIEGIAFIESSSQDGRSRITIEFKPGRDVDAAANDIRDRVSGVLDNLPDEADPPDIQKADSSDDVILWMSLYSDRMSSLELTDYAERYLVDRFSTLDGVARVRVGGGLSYSMRIWVDHQALAARNLTVTDVEDALRADNVELPAGSVESDERIFTARVERDFRTAEDFRNLVLSRGGDGYLVRLGDVARVEKAAVEERTLFRGNGVPTVGIGIIKQSQANTLEVTKGARMEAERISGSLPEGMELGVSYDTGVFIEGAINEVYKTLAIAIGLVILVIFLFLGSVRATIVPAVTVPVSLIGAFVLLYSLDFSINLLTLLALVLAIGLVVDDAIVVLENIHRRIEKGESPLVAAFKGSRQVGFAVIATTVVLISVFLPIAFTEGDVGRLFTEFALTMAAAVAISSFVALSLSPMLASKFLKRDEKKPLVIRVLDRVFAVVQAGYRATLRGALRVPLLSVLLFGGLIAGSYWLYEQTPTEFAPKEDRGAFFVIVKGAEGTSYDAIVEYMDVIEQRLLPLAESGEVRRLLVRAPRGFGRPTSFNGGFVIAVLEDWRQRRDAWSIINQVRGELSDLPGVVAFPIMRQGLGGGIKKPVQFVIGGGTYDQLAMWRDELLAEIEKDNPGLEGIDNDYQETKPQLAIDIDRDRAGDLGVSINNIGRTLETILGSRSVTTFIDAGQEYDVIIEGEKDEQRTPTAINDIFVRSSSSGALVPLANLVDIREYAGPSELNRYNRTRAITIEANLADGYSLGDALAYMNAKARDVLPESAIIDYKGQSRDLQESSGSLAFVFALGILVVFLVLAAQFESFIHPLVIILTVPLAVAGALLGIYLTGGSLNLYTQIGLIMLVGLAAKNGILIVEFVNQLRDEGWEFKEALVEASVIRLRPIIMTGITTAMGALPLILSFGAGAETRQAIGVVIFSGVIAATFCTLFIVPVAYQILARGTKPRGWVRDRLNRELEEDADSGKVRQIYDEPPQRAAE